MNQEINIVVGNPDNRSKNNYFFIEFLVPLIEYLKENKIQLNIIEQNKDINFNSNNLYIGIFNLLPESKIPKNYIMFNIEPKINRSRKYQNFLNNSIAILNFEEENYGFSKKSSMYHKNIYFPITYHPKVENIFNIDRQSYTEEYDVLFYGYMNERRINLVKI